MEYTSLVEIDALHAELNAAFKTGKSKSIAYRKEQLAQLAYLLSDNKQRFRDALAADLGRPALETDFLELGISTKEACDAYKEVGKWARPEKPPFSLIGFPLSPVIRKEPKGVVLIVSPFNFPVFLSLGPLIGAIAAGNAAVLKPSELTPATASLLAELIAKYLDPTMYRVVNGAIPETTKLLELRWDHILYTGSARIARIVATAAAKFLTPVSLELGGKSPVVIDPGCNLESAAQRLYWGKVSNAGQVCVAPDYVLVPRHFQDKLVDAIQAVHARFFPDGALKSDSYSRIATPMHFKRLRALVAETQGTIVIGGIGADSDIDEATRFFPPTVVKNVGKDDSLMREEIFGPILPIVPVDDLDEAIAFINANEHPLALYTFTRDSKFKKKLFDNTNSGSAVANEVTLQIGVDGLPFGGVGLSGYGQHTGKFSFDMFTHLRSSLDSPAWLDIALRARYPPYTPNKLMVLEQLSKPSLPPRPGMPRSFFGRGRVLVVSFVVALVGFFGARRALNK